jgi:short-subunit dehydrogenase
LQLLLSHKIHFYYIVVTGATDGIGKSFAKEVKICPLVDLN